MFQDNGDCSISDRSLSIQVGQLIYTSFQDCGFRMVMTPDTPLYIQRSFVEKIVNARWDPHAPPSSNFRAAYVYQSTSQLDYVVFGWLYYDGQDDFGRSGVPYFIAHYWLGVVDPERLQLILSCIEKGPEQYLERQTQGEDHLSSLTLDQFQNYSPARPGVTLPDEIWQTYPTILNQDQAIDWFIPQYDERPLRHHSRSIPQSADKPFQSRLHETTASGSGDFTVNTKQLDAILKDLVDKTMGIQGAALVSEEGSPIVSAIGLNETTLGIIAGTILYMTRETNRELNWKQVETVTLRGPDSYVMLNFCHNDVYLLIQSDKIPMGLLEGAVNRSLAQLKDALNGAALPESNREAVALMPTHNPDLHEETTIMQAEIDDTTEEPYPELMLHSTLNPIEVEIDNPDDDSSELTYRGRPAKS